MIPSPTQSALEGPIEISRLRLSLELEGPVPDVFIAADDGVVLFRARVDGPPPPLSASFATNRIIVIDVLEHVLDEQAWMTELAAVLEPGGQLTIRVPAEGPLAWLDALNIYRYLVDTFSRGKEPHQTQPMGWHRHYRPADLRQLFAGCGLHGGQVTRGGRFSTEIGTLFTLVRENFIGGDDTSERRLLIRRRNRVENPETGSRLRPIGSRLTMTGTKP